MEKREFHFSSPDSHIFLGFLSTVFGFVLFFMFFPFFYWRIFVSLTRLIFFEFSNRRGEPFFSIL